MKIIIIKCIYSTNKTLRMTVSVNALFEVSDSTSFDESPYKRCMTAPPRPLTDLEDFKR